MYRQAIFLISLFSLSLLIGFSLNKTKLKIHSINVNPTATKTPNTPASVESVSFDKSEAFIPCPWSINDFCARDQRKIKVTTVGKDKENDVLTYIYEVSGGRIMGQGTNVVWDFTGVSPGTYTIKAYADDGSANFGKTVTKTIDLKMCEHCGPPPTPCICPTIIVKHSTESIKVNDTATFFTEIQHPEQKTISYNWIVSGGTIIEGQGTPKIKVKTNPKTVKNNLMATVEIDYDEICDYCERTASDSIVVTNEN